MLVTAHELELAILSEYHQIREVLIVSGFEIAEALVVCQASIGKK